MPRPQQTGSLGGYESWRRTVNRTARTAPGRRAGPGGLDYHLARLGPEFANATESQRIAAAEAGRKAYYVRMALKSSQARRKKAS